MNIDVSILSGFTRPFLTDREIAVLLSVKPATVQWWRLTGKLRYIRAGRYPRVLKPDLIAFLSNEDNTMNRANDTDNASRKAART